MAKSEFPSLDSLTQELDDVQAQAREAKAKSKSEQKETMQKIKMEFESKQKELESNQNKRNEVLNALEGDDSVSNSLMRFLKEMTASMGRLESEFLTVKCELLTVKCEIATMKSTIDSLESETNVLSRSVSTLFTHCKQQDDYLASQQKMIMH